MGFTMNEKALRGYFLGSQEQEDRMEKTVKHTPGPWRMVEGPWKTQILSESHTPSNLVAEISTYSQFEDGDSRLIMVAPEMYKELHWMADMLKCGGTVRIDPRSIAAEQIISVISKADGEA